MGERVGRSVAIALVIICVILAVGLVGAIVNYTSTISLKDNIIASLNSEIANKDSLISDLQNQLNELNSTYTWLKQHSFTYYVVGNAINISNVGIYRRTELLNWYDINGTITNISNKPIKAVYVYLILRNPDGSAYPYDYKKIENLYIGETATFEFSLVTIEEGQTIEFFLVY